MIFVTKLFLFVVLFIFFCFNSCVVCRISNERKCVDDKCIKPISLARTLINYNADDDRLLSFSRNVNAKVFSKEAGDKPEFWEAKDISENTCVNENDRSLETFLNLCQPVINGKRGYVPKSFLKELKMLVKKSDVKFTVPTGRDDEPKHNVTQDAIDKAESKLLDQHSTPELAVANSKGLFSTIGGVSADSVPLSSPDINPQSAKSFEVVDGTTIYDETVQTMFMHEKPTAVTETPPIDASSSAKETITVEEKEAEKSKAADQPIVETEQVDKKDSENSSLLNNEISESKRDTKDHTVNDIQPKEDLPKAESSGSLPRFSMMNDVFNHVANFINSGTGPGEAEEIKEEDEDGSGNEEASDSLEENNSDGEKPADASLSKTVNIAQSASNEGINNHINLDNSQSNIEKVSKAPDFPNVLDKNLDEGSEIENPILNEATEEENLKAKYVSAEPLLISEKETNIGSADSKVAIENDTNNDIVTNVQNIGDFSSSVKTERDDTPVPSVDEADKSVPENVDQKQIDVTDSEELKTETSKSETSSFFKNDNQQRTMITPIADLDNDIVKKEEITVSSKENNTSFSAHVQDQTVDSNNSTESVLKPDSQEVPTIHLYSVTKDENSNLAQEESKVSDTTNKKPVIEQVTDREFVTISTFVKKDVSEKLPGESVGTKKESLPEVTDQQPQPEHEKEVVELQVEQEVVVPVLPDSSPSLDTSLHKNPLHQHMTSPVFDSPKQEAIESDKEEDVIDDTVKSDVEESQETVIQEIDKDEVLHEIPKEVIIEDSSSGTIPFEKVYSDAESEEYISIDTVYEEPAEGFLSWLNQVFSLFSSSDSNKEELSENDPFVKESGPELPLSTPPIKDESCLAEGVGEDACDSLGDVPAVTDYSIYPTDQMSVVLELLDKIPLETTVWLIITAVVVLIFSLGHYYIEAHRRDGPLVAVINKLEREVLILKKESCIQEDRLQTAQQQLEAWNTSAAENDALIVDLKQDLEETKAAKAELEEQVSVLEREVESVTESGLEMHRLLSESLSSQDGSQVLLSTVETLREKLEHQEDEIAGLSQSLSHKNIEVEELKEKLTQAAEVASRLEDKVIAVSRAKEEEALQLKDVQRQLIAQLEEVTETKALDETRVSADMSRMRLTLEELQKSLADKEAELEEVKEVVKQLRSTDSNDKMDALFDVVAVRAKLKAAASERDEFREKFQEEEGARKLLEGHMKKIRQEVAELKNSFETAEKEKIEALTKLQVLSNYFKEKESQLQKELGMQESMWLQKQSDDHSIYEQMRSLREENEKYKLQNESLKKEIVDQESSFKIQLANVEQKSHENWVASRQSERRLKEVQQEAAQLRNRLTMEKNNYSLDDSKPNISESNGDPSSPPPSLMFPPTASPPFMMYPMPPHGDFVPPPPLMSSPYPPDSRPPPLGRISSPPLDHRFSPPPPLPYAPYDYPSYGHHSPSPPPPIPSHPHHRNVHKPQPREMSREQKDHSMPHYSPEAEKTTRRNKR